MSTRVRVFSSSVGTKLVIGITGFALFIYLLIHIAGNALIIFGPEVFEYWGKRDPIGMYETYLERQRITRSTLAETEQSVVEEIAKAEKEAIASRDTNMPRAETVTRGVYAGPDEVKGETSSAPRLPRAGNTRKMPSR